MGFEPGQLILNVHVVSLLSVKGNSLQKEGRFKNLSELENVLAGEVPETDNSISAKQVVIKVSDFIFNEPAVVKLEKFEFDHNSILVRKVEQNNQLQSIKYRYLNK